MARPLRPNIAGATYHVMSRGNERQPIYRDDEDRERFLTLLGRVADRHRWECLAYCLMENHYHLVLRTPLPNLSRGMRMLNGQYATTFNERHDRVGHLFQGRFRGVLIRDPLHLLTVVKYVLRNPVIAGRCERASDWRWSSFAATVEQNPDVAMSSSAILRWFGDDPAAGERFAAFIDNDAAPLDAYLDIDEEFPVQASGEPPPPVEALLAGNPGIEGVALAHYRYGYSLRSIARTLGRDRAVLARELVAHDAARMLNDGAS